MALKWNTVQAEHVRAACDMVANASKRETITGIVVWHNEQALPAKEVLRRAYRLANNLAPLEKVTFASGEATVRLLNSLGFVAQRLGEPRSPKNQDETDRITSQNTEDEP